jgi:amidase
MAGPLAWPALRLARAIRARELSSEEATRAFLERIGLENEELSALVQVWPERALRTSRAFDKALAKNPKLPGVFAGVPTAIKDTDPVRGAWNRMGSQLFRYLWTPFDGKVASLVRKGGFNLVGKTATPELALTPVTEPALHAPCRNPWNPAFSSGGSSGGAGAAVASSMLPIAHASDAAGSIRIPAALCGVFGFKPSRNLLPPFYGFVDPTGLCVVNCLSTTVEDSAAFLDVLLGRDYALDAPPPDSLLAQSAAAPTALRIRYCVSSRACVVDPEVERAVLDTARALAELGHHVEEGAALDAELEDFLPLWQRMAANMPLPGDGSCEPTTRWLRAQGKLVPSHRAQQLTHELAARVLGWFGDADAWLTPTVGPHAPRIGAHLKLEDPATRFLSLTPLGAFTAPYNVSGQPAASVPAGLSSQGVPIGVQLAAPPGRDALLLALCAQLERARPWPGRAPLDG